MISKGVPISENAPHVSVMILVRGPRWTSPSSESDHRRGSGYYLMERRGERRKEGRKEGRKEEGEREEGRE